MEFTHTLVKPPLTHVPRLTSLPSHIHGLMLSSEARYIGLSAHLRHVSITQIYKQYTPRDTQVHTHSRELPVLGKV